MIEYKYLLIHVHTYTCVSYHHHYIIVGASSYTTQQYYEQIR